MSVNRYKPHVWVLPEDDANRQMANGFLLHPQLSARSIQVLEEVGGWGVVLTRFVGDHVRRMENFPDRFMILLIDFDGDADRLEKAKSQIPDHLADRVFVLGALPEPEALRNQTGCSYEEIGKQLAQECADGVSNLWHKEGLRHNSGELGRLRERVRPILFPNNDA